MKHYIDKDALVAEIERLVSNGKVKCQQTQKNNDQLSYIAWSEHIATCGKILSIIDTLEVKEVDLEKEFYNYIEHYRNRETGYTMFGIAEHFFELGIKAAQKGE